MRCRSLRVLAAVATFGMCLQSTHAQGSFQGLLESGSTVAVGRHLDGLQQRFEAGSASEVELRDAYRLFYKLDDAQVRALQRWVVESPTSYVAHLSLGVYLAHAAHAARGTRYVAGTSKTDMDRYRQLEESARKELDASLPLTAKPYLSLFQMLDLDGMTGDRVALASSERRASEMLPANHLVRERYVEYLTPRWGGSYVAMDGYIAAARRNGVPDEAVLRLEAIEAGDKALTARQDGDWQQAVALYKQAIAAARKADPNSLEELSLVEGRNYVCSHTQEPADCQP